MNILLVSCGIQLDEALLETKRRITQLASECGVEVSETDLDQLDFYPYITLDEYKVENKESVFKSQFEAYPDKYSEDILTEMDKIRKAKLLVFIVKHENLLLPTKFLGWVQRTFPIRFAVFTEEKNFKDKKFLSIFSQDETEFNYVQHFINLVFGSIGFEKLDDVMLTSINEIQEKFSLLKSILNSSSAV